MHNKTTCLNTIFETFFSDENTQLKKQITEAKEIAFKLEEVRLLYFIIIEN